MIIVIIFISALICIIIIIVIIIESGILQELGSIGPSVLESKNAFRQIINICIRTTYYVFVGGTRVDFLESSSQD